MKYILPISLGQYAYLKNERRISNNNNGTVVDAKYDSRLGLLIKEQGTTSFV